MPLKSEKNACLFGSLFRNYLPLHPISQLKALIISVFITIQGFDKTMFREEITVEGQSRIVLTKTVPHAKWIFVVLLISSLTSFVEKDKPTGGLNVGDMAPDFKIQTMSAEQSQTELSDLKGKYVLLSFWASYDAQSRMQNASLSNALRSTARNNVKMVSVSFDEYQSIFEETIRKDQIVTPTCFVETKGEYSGLFKKYRLGRGFTNYLLDDNGVIIAKNISAAELSAYLN